jgi:hypothetical protein
MTSSIGITCPKCSGPASCPIGFMVICPTCDAAPASLGESLTFHHSPAAPPGGAYVHVTHTRADGTTEQKVVQVAGNGAVNLGIDQHGIGKVTVYKGKPPKLSSFDAAVREAVTEFDTGPRPYGVGLNQPLKQFVGLSRDAGEALARFQAELGPPPPLTALPNVCEGGSTIHHHLVYNFMNVMECYDRVDKEAGDFQGEYLILPGKGADRIFLERRAAYWPIYWAGQTTTQLSIQMRDAAWQMAHDYLAHPELQEVFKFQDDNKIPRKIYTLLAPPHVVNDYNAGIWHQGPGGELRLLLRSWVGVKAGRQ